MNDIHKVSAQRMSVDMRFLTSLRPYRNYENPESLAKVREHIKASLLQCGYTTFTEQWWIPEGMDTPYCNLIVQYNPGHKDKIVIGGHYDVCGDQPGADDNGSAVVGLMETARLLMEQKPSLPYTIEMVWYCLEEPPFFGTEDMGSYVHAKSCAHDFNVRTMAMINYEMIGYFTDEPNSQLLIGEELSDELGTVGNFICAVGIEQYQWLIDHMVGNMRTVDAVTTHGIVFDGPGGWASLSDHLNYWNFGIPAVMINDTAMLRNHNYHKESDDFDTINFDKMAAVVDGVFTAAVAFTEYWAGDDGIH